MILIHGQTEIVDSQGPEAEGHRHSLLVCMYKQTKIIIDLAKVALSYIALTTNLVNANSLIIDTSLMSCHW